MLNYGSYAPSETVRLVFTKANPSTGARSAWSAALEEADLKIFKDGTVMTLTASTITFTHDADTSTGLDFVTVNMNNDTDFTWGSRYVAVLYPSDETLGGVAPIGIIGVWDTFAVPSIQGTFSGTHSSTTSDLGANAPANDIKGQTLFAPFDKESRVVTAYNTGTGVATHAAWATGTGVTNGEPWVLIPTAPIDSETLAAINAEVDTALAGSAILADTNELQTDWVNGGRLDSLIDAIKAKTDSLTFTVTNQVDANAVAISSDTVAADNLELFTEGTALGTLPKVNTEQINAVTVIGVGTSGDKWRA